jgi:hypothetical protein
MRVKLDENLGTRGVQIFQKHGHDVASVTGQGLQSSSDRDLIRVCAHADATRAVRRSAPDRTPEEPEPDRQRWAGTCTAPKPREPGPGRAPSHSRLTGRELPIGAVRVKKFVGTTQLASAAHALPSVEAPGPLGKAFTSPVAYEPLRSEGPDGERDEDVVFCREYERSGLEAVDRSGCRWVL